MNKLDKAATESMRMTFEAVQIDKAENESRRRKARADRARIAKKIFNENPIIAQASKELKNIKHLVSDFETTVSFRDLDDIIVSDVDHDLFMNELAKVIRKLKDFQDFVYDEVQSEEGQSVINNMFEQIDEAVEEYNKSEEAKQHQTN